MWRDLVIVVSLTLVFSFGVGVLFVHTLAEMFKLLFPQPNLPKGAEAPESRHAAVNS